MWNSVFSKLPPEGRKAVLVIFREEYGDCYPQYGIGKYIYDNVWYITEFGYTDTNRLEVLYWAELPEMPNDVM